jgi:hypothetical protein
MTATIKISDKTKKLVAHLQAKMILENGKKVSQIELIERVFDAILEHPEILDLIMEPQDIKALKEAWIKKTNSAPDWGISDSSEDIDSQIAGR